MDVIRLYVGNKWLVMQCTIGLIILHSNTVQFNSFHRKSLWKLIKTRDSRFNMLHLTPFHSTEVNTHIQRLKHTHFLHLNVWKNPWINHVNSPKKKTADETFCDNYEKKKLVQGLDLYMGATNRSTKIKRPFWIVNTEQARAEFVVFSVLAHWILYFHTHFQKIKFSSLDDVYFYISI